MKNNIRIEGKKVILRSITEDDVTQRYLGFLKDKKVKKYLDSKIKEYTMENLKVYVKEKISKKDCIFLAILDKESKSHIGNIKIEPIDYKNRKAGLGIMIGDKSFWEKGYEIDAMHTGVKFCFQELNLNKVWLHVILDNIYAVKIYEKVGFVKEEKLREDIIKNGKKYPVISMGLLKKDFLEKKTKIFLCDFVHNYSGTGTFMFPLNIGFIAAYTNKFFSKDIDIKLFKFPQNFIDRFKKEKADIVCFSNYIWNADVNCKFSKWIKSKFPDTIIIYGGPNINCTEKGYKKFFSTHPATDFYIPYQGETPFVNLLKEIFNKNLNISALKSKAINGIVFYDKENDKVIRGNFVPKIKDPDDIPSPYLTGLLDKFFDTNLIPLVETNRGCPYTCTFCAQGLSSHHHMEFFSLERVKQELDYVVDKVKNTNLIMFTDSNFGIVDRDMEIAKYIAKLKKEKGYPRKFNANWAKNQPKIFEIAKILDNINLVISLQSLDENVLKNIKRKNIELSVFKNIIDRINNVGGMSATEIILGLPGETKESHLKTIRTLFDWDVSYIICYLAMLLDGSELSLMKENGAFKCMTKFRYLDNGFGKYDDIIAIETEEGIRSTSVMSEQDMLYFRPVHWIIQFLWNYRFGYTLLKYLQSLEINPLDYILKLINQFDNPDTSDKIKKIFNDFKEEANKEWFDSREELQEFFSKPENFKVLEHGQYGKLNGKYIFRILLEAREDFDNCLYNTAISFPVCKSKKSIIKDILKFSSTSIIDFNNSLEDISKEIIVDCNYNILKWTNSKHEENLENLYTKEGIKFRFYLPEEQKQSLKVLLKQYAHKNKNVTLRKMSEFMDIRDCFRKASLAKSEA